MKLWLKVVTVIGVIILIMSGFYLYAKYIGTTGFHSKEYALYSNTISNEYNGLKIAHISDIHYGFKITKKELENIIDDINKHKPDIVLLTGDLVDNNLSDKQYDDLVEVLRKLNPTIGSYAIDGNHDYKYKKWASLIEDSGFINLNDSYEVVYNESYESIFIAGVSNNTFSTKKIQDKTEVIFDYMNSPEYKSKYSILLMHEPDFIDDIDYKEFNVVLAGHSHNGQVRLPFIGALYTPKNSKKYYKPYYKLNNTEFYISSGIGESDIAVRLFNRPSYNFYRLYKK